MHNIQKQTSRSLRFSVIDGAAFSFMVGIGESFFPAFILALGLGEVRSGLIAVLPMVVGAVLQMISPAAIRKMGSSKRWVLTCALAQAFAFIPLVFQAGTAWPSYTLVFFSVVIYWAGGLGTGAAWTSWMARLVPPQILTRYFASRNRYAHIGILVGLLVGGFVAEAGQFRNQPLTAFAIMFGLASIARLISTYCLSQQHEPELTLDSQAPPPMLTLFRSIMLHQKGRVLQYLLLIQVAANISGPYFAPYMLSELKLNYIDYMILTSAAFLSRIILLPWIGQFAARWSASRLLLVGGIFVIPIPTLWIFSSGFYYLLFLQILTGAGWAVYELGMTLAFFEDIGETTRTSTLTLFNLLNALAIALGGVIGGQILNTWGVSKPVYYSLWIFSSLGRAVAVLFFRGRWNQQPSL